MRLLGAIVIAAAVHRRGAAVAELSDAPPGVTVLTVQGRAIEGLGYHYYGPPVATIEAEAVWVRGDILCSLPSTEPGSKSALAGMVVVSNTIGCLAVAFDMYNELDARGVAAYVHLSTVTCPRSHIYGRGMGPSGEAGSMAMVSIPSKIKLVGGADDRVTTATFLEDTLPHWSPEEQNPPPAATVGVSVLLEVADPEVSALR